MSQPPERPDGPTPGPDEPEHDPLSALFGGPVPPEMREALESMGIGQMDPAMLQAMQAQVRAMLAADDGSAVNATVAHDTARALVARAGDPSIGERTSRDTRQVVQVADLWLDAVTDLPRAHGGGRALSRAEWVELTLPAWRDLIEPVAVGVGGAIERAMGEQMTQLEQAPPELLAGLPQGLDPQALLGQAQSMMRAMSGSMVGAQLGQAVGALAGEMVSGTEVGLPIVPGEEVTLIASNVAAFAEGLGVDAGEVHLYLAVREAARVRLFAGVPWLGPQLLGAVRDYARDISIDTDAIERAVREADASDPAALQEALSGSLFSPEPSPAQQAALSRLETYLALVEGWVDTLADRATTEHLPHAAALAEAVRRRRAEGGPAEKVFSSLVGLRLRPRRLRDAANLWAALEQARGPQARDDTWVHPDLTPTAADLDDPLGYVERTGAVAQQADTEMDQALERLLRGED